MRKTVIFGGTSEGRQLAEELAKAHVATTVSVATEYGEQLLASSEYIRVHTGRMDETQMKQFLKEEQPELVIDATHPYASVVSQTVNAVCLDLGMKVVRLAREANSSEDVIENYEKVHFVDCAKQAGEVARLMEGSVFVSTGSKELQELAGEMDDKDRLVVRVLPSKESLACCEKAGMKAGQLIGMQGPFSAELNAAMFREKHAKILITKASGIQGGYREKLQAAVDCGMDIIIIRPPRDEGLSMSQIREMLGLGKTTNLVVNEQKKRLYLVGIGMGHEKGLTGEAREVFAQAQIIFGASRMLESVATIEKVESKIADQAIYTPEDVCGYLKAHPYFTNVAVALSGDVGFYSGARKYYEIFQDLDWEITSVCGISSVVYFSSKLGIPWQSLTLCSKHGKEAHIASLVKRNRGVFALFSNAEQVRMLSERFLAYGMDQVTMHVGWDLGYCSENRNERIKSGLPADFLNETQEGLCVGIFENPDADISVTGCHADADYERMEKVPMTKEEIRALVLSKLRLQKTSIVYDIGAGTGGVTMDLAHYVTEGSVYAIERNEKALSLLERNINRFGAESVCMVSGTAPEVLEHLPMPTHAFIGGSAGRLAEIVECLYEKNPAVRIVIAAVTIETIAEVTRLVQEGVIENPQISQVSVARAKTAGAYHLMSAENPIYLITILPSEKQTGET